MTADVYGTGAADTMLGRALDGLPRDSYCLIGIIGHDIYPGKRDGAKGFLRFTDEVGMRVGEVFRLPSPGTGGDRKAETAAATELVMRRIAALLPPAYRGIYGDPEPGGSSRRVR